MIGGTRYFFDALSLGWKQIRTLIRNEFLSLLATFVSIAVILTERGELIGALHGSWPRASVSITAILAILTIATAVGKLAGNLTASQDSRFLMAMRLLLSEVEKFSYGKDREFDVAKRLDHFVERFLEITSNVLGGQRLVEAALLVPERDLLILAAKSKGADYPSRVNISLELEDESGGPAKTAFLEQKIAYMPSRHRELSFEFVDQHYVPSGYSPRRSSSSPLDSGKYRSLLCLPVSSYETRSDKVALGVLCFSSTATDAFLERDLLMGECFSTILGQVFHVSRSEAKREPFVSTGLINERTVDATKPPTHSSVRRSTKAQKTLYLRGLELENIRCFVRFRLSFEDENGCLLTTVIIGDNASGKSTILRSIALGLCPESDAVSLMKKLPGSFLRKGAKRGSIVLHLRSADGKFEGSIRTTIEAPESGTQEVIRQTTDPIGFPWDDVFICGYGTQRNSGRPFSPESYETRLAVASLFSDSSDLLNPEVVLLRRDPKESSWLEGILKKILLLEGSKTGIRRLNTGIELAGPWGSHPLMAVSDGYRSTSQWVLDYLGWHVFADRLQDGAVDGMLLVDEVEQHLHPRWQRYLLQRLRSQFDETQIIVSTHTPLIAAGVADIHRSQVVRLLVGTDGFVEPQVVEKEFLTGKRADQILGDAFGLITSKSPGTVTKIDRYTELLSSDRTPAKEVELKRLRNELDDAWSSGDNAVSRTADKVVSKVLDEMIEEGRTMVEEDRGVIDAQVRQRLSELFNRKEKK